MATYMPRPVLADSLRRGARRAIHSARYWREEASAPMCIFTPKRCRAEMRESLAEAGDLRRELARVKAGPYRIYR